MADPNALRATQIADQVEPRFRHGARSYGCGGHVAKLWGAAWEGAYIALGGDPAAYVGCTPPSALNRAGDAHHPGLTP